MDPRVPCRSDTVGGLRRQNCRNPFFCSFTGGRPSNKHGSPPGRGQLHTDDGASPGVPDLSPESPGEASDQPGHGAPNPSKARENRLASGGGHPPAQH